MQNPKLHEDVFTHDTGHYDLQEFYGVLESFRP